MNDEIKEILEEIDNKIIPNEHWNKIKDYITNLQEELRIRDTNWQSLKYYLEKLYDRYYIEEEIFDDICKRVNELESQIEIKSYQKEIINLQQEIKDYKSRCEKLREYINTHKVSDTISFPLMKKEEENQVKSCFDYEFEQIYKKELLNILNGGDE